MKESPVSRFHTEDNPPVDIQIQDRCALCRHPCPVPDEPFDPDNGMLLSRTLNKLFFLAAIKCDNPAIGIFRMRFHCRSCSESFKSIQVSYIFFLLHLFSLSEL